MRTLCRIGLKEQECQIQPIEILPSNFDQNKFARPPLRH
jgi:hypothetical protein